ncbi:MAG TPA: hypothetical protein VGL94_03070 [Ktedonobacteraceae bacterium]|jgi:hypothetical protein
MVGDGREPVIIPGPVGDAVHRNARDELERLRRDQARRRLARNRLPKLPDDPGKLREIREGVVKGTGEFFTGIGHDIADTILTRPDGPAMRKHVLSEEEYRHEIEKYAEGLKQSKIEWQKEAGNIIHDILKLGDNAAELYEAFQEYPFSDNFKDYGADKEKAANKRDFRMSLINQAIALYYWNTLKDLEKLKITDKPEFKEVQHSLDTLKAKLGERAAVDGTATEFETQAALAQFQLAHSQKRDRESLEHSVYIQDRVPNNIGQRVYALRLHKAGWVKNYSKQAEERATELEKVLEHVEKHRQKTEAKIAAYISQAQKRAYAAADAAARLAAVNGMVVPFANRVINAQNRTTNATNRSIAFPIGNNLYKGIADRIITGTTTGADNVIIGNISTEVANAGVLALGAEVRARDAETRARDAETRARDAEVRARIAKAYEIYNNPTISDKSAKDVLNHCKNIEQWEKQIVENTNLVKLNEKTIQNSLSDINVKIGEMQNIMNIAAVTPITPEQVDNLARLANEIEIAEIAKNSAIVFEIQASRDVDVALTNIRNELLKVSAALLRENATETAITNLANPDLRRLRNLVAQQRALERTLKGTPVGGVVPAVTGLIEREGAQSQAAQAIEQAILNGQANIGALKMAERVCRTAVAYGRVNFQQALTNVMNTERAVAEALKRNAIHMEQDITGDADQAIEHLQKIKDDFADQDEEGLKKGLRGHLFIDPYAGKFTIGDEAIWMSVREVNDWGPPESATLHPGETHATYRPDIVKIETNIVTREAKALEVESIYTKRLAKRYFKSENYEYTLEVAGNRFAGGGRREAVLTIIDLKKQDGRIAKPGGGVWTQAEYTKVERIPMEAAGTIKIVENHNNQNSPIEVEFKFTIETMPNPVINHAQALARRQGPGWSEEQKRRMWRLDLDRRMLILPNGQEYSMDDFDWTESKWDEENGLSLQFKGPGELSQVNLLAAGSADIFDQKLLDATAALKKKKRKHVENGIEWLKQSIKSYDENKINEALGSLQNHEGVEAYQSNVTKNELERPPKNRLNLEKLRKKKKAERNALTPKWVAHCTKSAAEMLGARRGYENEVKDRIQAIHKTNPLSATRVWKSHASPEKYALVKHSSSKKKQELRDEIRAANHLDTMVSFQLLEDPKRGPAGPASPVKNAAPNGLELLREYNLYKNKQDFADQIERQNVEHYVASIATEFRTNPNIHPYYTNQWYLEQAIAAAKDGNISGKEENGNHIPGASEYIRKLKQVDCPLPSDNGLASKRQNDEYHWVTYLRDALSEAERQGIPELLEGALPAAKWMQEFRFSNLELAEKALYLDTSSDNAKKLLDDIHIIENPLSWSEPKTEEKAKVDTSKDKNPFDSKEIIKKSDGELAQAAVEVAGDQYQQVINRMESLLASVTDPALQKKYREAALQMTSEYYKNEQEIFKLAFAKRERLEALELWDEKQKEWWKRDLVEKLALMWIQQGINAANKGLRDAEGEFVKLLKKVLAV